MGSRRRRHESDSDRKEAVKNMASELWTARPLIFDTETTGLTAAAEIVEITVVDVDGTILLDALVKPSGRIPSQATQIHGITTEKVAEAPSWPGILQLLVNVGGESGSSRLTSFNREFDMRMVRQSSERADCLPLYETLLELIGEGPQASSDCIMLMYALLHGEYSDYRGDYK